MSEWGILGNLFGPEGTKVTISYKDMGIYSVATVIFAFSLLTLVCIYLPCQIVMQSMKIRKRRHRFERAFAVTKSLVGAIACIAIGIGLFHKSKR
jgi:hypothetical protein